MVGRSLIRPRVVDNTYGLPDAGRWDQIRSYDGREGDAEGVSHASFLFLFPFPSFLWGNTTLVLGFAGPGKSCNDMQSCLYVVFSRTD